LISGLSASGQIKSVVGGELIVAVRHQGALVGEGFFHQRHQSRIAASCCSEGIALDIEFKARMFLHQRRQVANIAGADMTLIRTRVDGDAVGPGINAELSEGGCRRVISVAGIADQGNLVEVDAQLDHGASAWSVTTLARSICTGSIGRCSNSSTALVRRRPMAFTTSMPSTTLPNTV